MSFPLTDSGAPSPEEQVAQLGSRAIGLRSLDDAHCLRACTPITTTEAEVELLLGALRALA